MVSVQQFQSLCNDILQNVDGIESLLIVVDQNHTVKKIKDKAGKVLVAVLPSAAGTGGVDNLRNTNASLFFIVEKGKVGEVYLDQYSELQSDMLSIQSYLLERASNQCGILQRLETESMNIDAVYNEFGGYNGWVMSVIF